ncbi:MAG: hypothetical protein ABIT08_00395 [Bacteroidia bacterium]
MKARQIQKINSYLTLIQICRENIAIIAMIPAMMRCLKQFDALLKEILLAAEKQALPTKHHADKKLENRIAMTEFAAELASVIRAYALTIPRLDIAAPFDFCQSDLTRVRQYNCLFRCMYVHKFLVENLDCFQDFGIRKKEVDHLEKLIKNYNDVFILPRSAKIERMSATSLLAEKIEQTDKLLNDQMSSLLPSFRQFPAFCKSFKAARKQIKYGRPKEVLKKKIKKYRAAPVLPRTRKSSKPVVQLKPLMMPEETIFTQELIVNTLPVRNTDN